MNYQELVDSIVDELYKKLLPHNSILPSVIVIGDSVIEASQQGINMIPFESSMMNVHDHSPIVITNMSCTMLAHLALGIGETLEEQYILTALLKGRNVYLLDCGIEYHQYKQSAYKNLYILYLEYENQIKRCGIQIISNIGEADLLGNHSHNEVQESSLLMNESNTASLISQKLLLEIDVRNAYRQGAKVLQIKKNTIITPLADDFIKSHHLLINRV